MPANIASFVHPSKTYSPPALQNATPISIMSKAFTKESDNQDDDDAAGESSQSPLPTGAKNYMTPAGAQRLQAELKKLRNEERPKLVNTIAWAAGNGDRSENADYIYGKRRLREIDRRVRFLIKRLESAEVVDPSSQSSDRVLFGASVTVRDEGENTRTYRIVGIDETDAANGLVSWISPIAKALLNAKVGQVVTLRSPKGEEDLEILKIEYILF